MAGLLKIFHGFLQLALSAYSSSFKNLPAIADI